ncbi:MerR family transcriptional regulator [Actinoallomurus iriomotensis]|uniref:HTH merR-type domain-containing protein n=1 Tax=Actinoallomurus iriomotensis TaxID=478107 RepID=A0A9W6VS49_9ACTN|nr:MerR family transcriptional regulator [Actinoallomurus iriomotensis]GLY76266.1 hypothetical protein Airi01_045330 [Actinoallomurus iriomotensis]
MLEVKPQPESGPARSDPRTDLSVAEAARRTGVSVHTLRYCERVGLVVTPIGRTAGGRRRYHQLDLDWIVVCTKLRATGMPIKTIRRYAQLVSGGYGNEQERLALLEAHRADVTAKLTERQENLRVIDHRSTSTEAASPWVGPAQRVPALSNPQGRDVPRSWRFFGEAMGATGQAVGEWVRPISDGPLGRRRDGDVEPAPVRSDVLHDLGATAGTAGDQPGPAPGAAQARPPR